MNSVQPVRNLKNKRVTVMGLGRFGGGVGAVRFLAERGARVTVTDLATEQQLEESLAQLDRLPLAALHLGGHQEPDFRDADLVLVNPAVPSDNRFLKIAEQNGVSLTSEMNLFWQLNRAKTVGVTGSNGKSTTAALLHAILQSAGVRSWLGGNIGRSLLPLIDEIRPDDWCVLELSSFQLEDLDRIAASPQVAVVTNFSPNHLDRHGTLAAYRHAKQTILRWQRADDVTVLNLDDPDVRNWPVGGRQYGFGRCEYGYGLFSNNGRLIARHEQGEYELPLEGWLKLPGAHNLQNAMAAAVAAIAIDVPASAIQRGLESFEPLPHRLQFVADVASRKFYNDSLATTPESATAALNSFAEPVVLLAGGYDKQIDLGGLANAISAGAKAVALMGQTAAKLERLLVDRNSRNKTPQVALHKCLTFDEAFRWAVERSSPGDLVLLSPGCASYDWFSNFAERGERFVELVRGLLQGWD